MRIHQHQGSVQFLLAIFALQLLSWNAGGEVWKSQELNCEISLPAGRGWNPAPAPAPILKVAMINQAEGKTIAVYVVDAPRNNQTLSSFLPGFKQSWFKEGVSTDGSEEALEIDGRDA